MMRVLKWLFDGEAWPFMVALALIGGIGLGWMMTSNYYSATIAKNARAQAKREAAIATAVLETQRQHFKQMGDALDEAQKQTNAANAGAAAANAANRGLRDALNAYKAKRPATACTGQGKPDTDPVGVLADLLGGCSDRYSAVARYADQVKIAGAACEAAWPQ